MNAAQTQRTALQGVAVACKFFQPPGFAKLPLQPSDEAADIIFTKVPDTPDVEAVLFGETVVVAGLTKGKTVVDMSSVSPLVTKNFAQKINALGCDYLNPPVPTRPAYVRR